MTYVSAPCQGGESSKVRSVALNIPSAVVDEIFFELETRHRGGAALCVVGECRRNNRIEFLHRSKLYTRRPDIGLGELVARGLCPIAVWVGKRLPGEAQLRDYIEGLQDAGAECGGALAFVTEKTDIRAFGWLRMRSEFLPIGVLSMPGPQMLELAVEPMWPLSKPSAVKSNPSQTSKSEEHDEQWVQELLETLGRDEKENEVRLSRLALFLGEGNFERGKKILARGARLRVIVVGCGRLGERLTLYLAQSGVGAKGHLIVADGDIVESPNLDFMLLPRNSLGQPKAEATASTVSSFNPEIEVTPLVGTVSDPAVARAVARSEMVFSCVDRDAARLGIAALASRYLVVHFDLSGGAAYTRDGDIATGGEVRVALPGRAPCVACMSQLNWDAAHKELGASAEEQQGARLNNDWQRERPGSCGSLLDLVLGTATLQLWRILQGKLRNSLWLHLNADGVMPVWEDWTERARNGNCRVCSEHGVTGLGDRGLEGGL